jgi:hypothetical protein
VEGEGVEAVLKALACWKEAEVDFFLPVVLVHCLLMGVKVLLYP